MNIPKPLINRFWTYLNERFPLQSHGILISSFSFSAIGYSRMCQDISGFIDWKPFLVCIFNTVTLFFLLRVFDEHKDAEDDAKFRQELPVPRGLISLKELKTIGWFVFGLQILISALTYPKMLPLYAIAIGYLLLMGKEFFVADWLKKHQFWYVTSHMLIIPLIDIYASGYDWYLNENTAPFGLVYFFGVSFFNGVVLELGRKIRAPHDEKPGVQTYSTMLGLKKSVYLWIIVLFTTLILALLAAEFADLPKGVYLALATYFVLTLLASVRFLKNPTSKAAKTIEIASGAWTILMYLTLGGILTVINVL